MISHLNQRFSLRLKSLPYWDWEEDADDEGGSTVFEMFGSLTRHNRETGECLWQTVHDGCLDRDINDEFGFWSMRRVLGMVTNFEQYTDDWENASERNNGFRTALEGGPHATPHNYLGAIMTTINAPDDPLFYLHHANVDRIWSIWQDYRDHDLLLREEYVVPIHYGGQRIDQPMSFPSTDEISWDFRLSETGNYPTPRDMLNNNDRIHVRYVEDQMARTLNYSPNPDWFQPASSSDIWESRCDRRLGEERRILKHGGHRNGPVGTLEALQSTSLRGRSDGTIDYFKNEEQQTESMDTSLDECLSTNTFSRRADRDDWDRLCHEMPLTATYAERMAAMAQDECNRKGNPFGATPEWIEHVNMSNELVTFECFHLPDRIEV
jgi:Common central domain of tyrosinase